MNSTKINVSDFIFAGKAEYIVTLQHCVETNGYLLNWLINSTPWMVKLGPFNRTTLFSLENHNLTHSHTYTQSYTNTHLASNILSLCVQICLVITPHREMGEGWGGGRRESERPQQGKDPNALCR